MNDLSHSLAPSFIKRYPCIELCMNARTGAYGTLSSFMITSRSLWTKGTGLSAPYGINSLK